MLGTLRFAQPVALFCPFGECLHNLAAWECIGGALRHGVGSRLQI